MRVSRGVVTVRRLMTTRRWQSAGAPDEVLLSEHGIARLITLNRPKALNSLNYSMVKVMTPWYRQWLEEASEGQQRIVVMKGAGGKAFCAGGDVVAIAQDTDGALRRDFFRDEYKLNYMIKTLPFPHVALLDGITMGGGVGLSVHGSHRVVTESTMFAMPETGIGLFPDVGGSIFLPRLPYAGLGMYLALTGYRLKGADCLHAGIGTHFVNKDVMSGLEKELLGVQSAGAVDAVLSGHAKQLKTLPAFSLEPHLERIARTFTLTSLDDIIEDLRRDETDWTKGVLSTLNQMSPTSLRVTHEQIVRGARQSPHDCFAMEARIVWAMMHTGTDFNEGIRALLIDKDKSPKWNPPTLGDVSPELVAKYFAPLENEWSA